MKAFKLLMIIMAVGSVGVLSMEKAQLLLVKNEKTEKTVKKMENYKIDPKIKDQREYFVDSRLKSIYTELAKMIVLQDKEIRIRLMYVKDMSPDEITQKMSDLEPFYNKERKKLEDYCTNGSKNCAIEVRLTGESIEGADISLKVDYKLDEQSLAFFNEVNYVHNTQKKWYSSRLTHITEKRLYPQKGKFQDRQQDIIMKDDTSENVDVSHVLEGNSNQWNVKY